MPASRITIPVLAIVFLLLPAVTAHGRTVEIAEFRLSAAKAATLSDRWADRILARHATGTWAPLRHDLTDRDLATMGLPPHRVLAKRRYRRPTAVRNGRLVVLGASKRGANGKGGKPSGDGSGSSSAVTTFAGTGFFGIRPGAWYLIITDKGVSWCSLAHVYGASGSYAVSTAGHCGKVGDVATMIGVVGNRTPVLLDIGKFSKSTGDGGIGRDWALISVPSGLQHLVTPTMAFWGGPIGMYTATGEVLGVDLSRGRISPNPDPVLVQQIVHYGHGLGVGTGGTPRSGTAITWRKDYFTFFGVLSPGDSGSGSNTLTGDTLGANREAAGINTHIYVDPSMRTGTGVMAGTRATLVSATLANGQILPYPLPIPAAP